MFFVTEFLAETARKGGLHVFVSNEDQFVTRMRISAGNELHIIVTLAQTGRGTEEIISAKMTEIAMPQDHIFVAQIDAIDGNTRALALLGWVITEIQDMADRKAVDEQRFVSAEKALKDLRRQRRSRNAIVDTKRGLRRWEAELIAMTFDSAVA